MTITPDLRAFQTRINEMLARLEVASRTPFDQLAAALLRFERAFGGPSPRPPRPLIHNGRAPKGRR